MRDKMMVMTKWLENLHCTEEQKKEICYRIIKYGCLEEYVPSEDPVVSVVMDFILPQIDSMQESYEAKIENGHINGRQVGIDPKEVWTMAQSMTGSAIAELLGVPKTTLYSNIGWKKRKDKDFLSTLPN